jgi:hypothetical protein
MRSLAPFASLAVLLAPAVALACPAGAHGCSGCGSSFLANLLALGGGVLAGLASIAIERRFFER